MKKFTILMIRSYLGPFVLTFFIALFVLVMQFLWKYIDQLVGKGLEWSIILELLFYASASLVPLALPLAILLSSIMTLGSFAENFELVAVKAVGISLLRILRPLIILSALISLGAFLFANYGMPVANYKLKSLLISIQRTRPAIDIPEGSFYDGIKGVEIFVEKKEADGKSFQNILIYDHSKDIYGAASVTMARRGSLSMSEDQRYLILKLYQGMRLDDRNFFTHERKGLPLYREIFSEQQIYFDLSGTKFTRYNEAVFRNQYSMMTIGQLDLVHEQLLNDLNNSINFASKNMLEISTIRKVEPLGGSYQEQWEPQLKSFLETSDSIQERRKITTVDFRGGKFLSSYTEEEKAMIRQSARQSAEEIRNKLEEYKSSIKAQKMQIAKNRVEYHRKFSLSFACFILFFVGAPLGAIIRKGGLGLPLIFCIVIFIIYYVISTIGEKSVRQLALPPFEGMWLSSFILFPFALFLTLKASSDSPLFIAETYTKFFQKIVRRKK